MGVTKSGQQGTRNRRLCVEELRRDRRDRPGAMATWLPALIGALQQRFPELVVSRTRLYCWDGLYQRPCDLVKLVDLRGGDRRSQGGPESWKAFKDLYLHPNQPSVKQCWREVHRLAREEVWAWCSLKSCHAQMDKRIDPETQVQHRQPAVYRHQMEPTIEQNPEAWKAGECWVGDHKQLDMWCMYAEKLVRPWLTTWMDWRTRRVAGYVLSDNPNSSTILAALRHGCSKWLKQHLHIKSFYGTSPNAVQIQIWVAVIVYVLVLQLRHRHGLRQDPNQILQILSVMILKKNPDSTALFRLGRPNCRTWKP